jgi:Zn-dependent membrane protease YugP
MGRHRQALALAWLAIATLTTVLIVGNAREAIRRYRALDSGWSWDLAYYNQWFWSLTQGDGRITVRPVASYGQEDLSIWRSNYLAPIRLAIAPIYALRPGPETLLVVEAVLLWMVVPAAFVLARGESGSVILGLASACLVPLTPLLVPIAANDFRELQLGIPFVVLAVEGMRGRRRWLATAGITGMLACRQEYAVIVASLGLIPPRQPEDLGRTARWARATFYVGVAWWLIFLLYVGIARGYGTVTGYLVQFAGEKLPLEAALPAAGEILLLGLGAWSAMLVGLPRMWLVVFPWAWCVARAGGTIGVVGTEQWSSVRYMAPLAGIGIAAGLVGLCHSARLIDLPGSRLVVIAGRLGTLAVAAMGLVAARAAMQSQSAYAPPAISRAEADGLLAWIGRVGPSDGVLTDYPLAAPLSSRKTLKSYRMTLDQPWGFPHVGPDYRWIFARPSDLAPDWLTAQGFEVVHRGETTWVFHRANAGSSERNPPDRRLPGLSGYQFELGDINRLAWSMPLVGFLGWGWLRLRSAWRSASLRRATFSGSGAVRAAFPEMGCDAIAIVAEGPLDLADPARRVVRLAKSTASAGHAAACTLAAVEAAHLRLAMSAGPTGWLARYRPALMIAVRLGTVAGVLAIADGIATGCRLLLDLGLQGFFAAAALGLLALPLEYLAVRDARRASGDLDRALLRALPWRPVVEVIPLAWRREPRAS